MIKIATLPYTRTTRRLVIKPYYTIGWYGLQQIYPKNVTLNISVPNKSSYFFLFIIFVFLFQGGSSPNELRNLGAKEAKDLYTKLGRLPIQASI